MILEATPLKDGNGKELRVLHDTVQQHVRALKSLGYEPSELDETTMFEWQSHSQKCAGVPHYNDLLEFLNLRAQATEAHSSDRVPWKSHKPEVNSAKRSSGFVGAHAASVESRSSAKCSLCNAEKHPLYACPKFKSLPHESKLSVLKSNKLCSNCLGSGHFWRQCTSVHKCKVCQKPHHTLLHLDQQSISSTPTTVTTLAQSATPQNGAPVNTPQDVSRNSSVNVVPGILSATAIGVKYDSLLMTCRVRVKSPKGSDVVARALLDSASSASFVSERLAQTLGLPRTKRDVVISGIAGITHQSQTHSFTTFKVAPVGLSTKVLSVTAAIVPQVTCELPPHPIDFKTEWNHLTDLQLADPEFGSPDRIDLLLGVDIFVNVLLTGRRCGKPGTPTAFETHFSWVLAGSIQGSMRAKSNHLATYHVALNSYDGILRKFWEIEDSPLSAEVLSPEERATVNHFEANHWRLSSGGFVVPLPKKQDAKPIGESRSQAVRRFLLLECTLRAKNQFNQFGEVMKEYFDLGHAELVLPKELNLPTSDVFYLPMHAVHKQSSTTTKVCAVFDASMKSASGVSLNDTLMVGPTVHPQLVDVLIRFRTHRIALVADVSKMYRAVELPPADRNLHRFVWRPDSGDTLKDFRMTQVTFGVASCSFVANMCMKHNAGDFAQNYPLAAKVVNESFYVDDCLTGADTVERAIETHQQLQELFSKTEFLLRKWNSSSPAVLESIPVELHDSQTSLTISEADDTYTKTLGIEWHSVMDHFRLDVSNHQSTDSLTKRKLVSDIAKTYDVLGWFAPAIVKVKILLQRLWESKVDWDDPVPESIEDVWFQWHSQLKLLSQVHIPRYYFPKDVQVASLQLHGFCDASEDAYSGVVYLRMEDTNGDIHVTLVAAKTRVAPIKRLSIPRLKLCGAYLLTKLLNHVGNTLQIPIEDITAWTDSTIVINWLDGSPRRFKTYVGNRISFIIRVGTTSRVSRTQLIVPREDSTPRN